jgi:acetolactate synthase-1/3 small subunit
MMTRERHILTALMENRPGVLNRVVSLFRQRSFNLDSLTVGRTERKEVSRMTLVVEGSEEDALRVQRELGRLLQIIQVDEMDEIPHVARDLVLVKVAVTPETRQEIQHLCDTFRARVVDVSKETLSAELTGDEAKIEGFIELLRPFRIVELARSGLVAMGRGDKVLDDHGYRSSWAEMRSKLAGGPRRREGR